MHFSIRRDVVIVASVAGGFAAATDYNLKIHRRHSLLTCRFPCGIVRFRKWWSSARNATQWKVG